MDALKGIDALIRLYEEHFFRTKDKHLRRGIARRIIQWKQIKWAKEYEEKGGDL